MRRIVLFIPFAPEIGGGSVRLRSYLAQLQGLDVDWYYFSKKTVGGERRQI
jgi:hypothetical protein